MRRTQQDRGGDHGDVGPFADDLARGQHPERARSKVGDPLGAGGVVQAAVDARGLEAIQAEHLGHMLGMLDAGAEHHGRLTWAVPPVVRDGIPGDPGLVHHVGQLSGREVTGPRVHGRQVGTTRRGVDHRARQEPQRDQLGHGRTHDEPIEEAADIDPEPLAVQALRGGRDPEHPSVGDVGQDPAVPGRRGCVMGFIDHH